MLEPNYHKSVHLIPHTIYHSFSSHSLRFPSLGTLENDRIIFVLIDAMGMNVYLKYMPQFGYTLEISSVFPSTTAAALTSIFTGLSPKEHGILEWYMYYEGYGDIIKTIPFSPAGVDEYNALLNMGYNPKNLFDMETIFSKLEEVGVPTSAYIRAEYLDSAYSRYMLRHTSLSGYTTIKELANSINKDSHSFIYVYLDDLDIAQHAYGPNSEETKITMKKIKNFLEALSTKDTTLVVSADHGQTEIDKKIIENVNCPVGGSPRDMFVYCDYETEQYSIQSHEILRLLGPGIENKNLQKRVPKKIILPSEHEAIWFKSFDVRGLHGGLSKDELLVPLIIIEG